MVGSALFNGVLVIQAAAAELLGGEIEDPAAGLIEAMEASLWQGDAPDPSAEEILSQKGRDRALAQGGVLLAPAVSQPGRTSLGAPAAPQGGVELLRRGDPPQRRLNRRERMVITVKQHLDTPCLLHPTTIQRVLQLTLS